MRRPSSSRTASALRSPAGRRASGCRAGTGARARSGRSSRNAREALDLVDVPRATVDRRDVVLVLRPDRLFGLAAMPLPAPRLTKAASSRTVSSVIGQDGANTLPNAENRVGMGAGSIKWRAMDPIKILIIIMLFAIVVSLGKRAVPPVARQERRGLEEDGAGPDHPRRPVGGPVHSVNARPGTSGSASSPRLPIAKKAPISGAFCFTADGPSAMFRPP